MKWHAQYLHQQLCDIEKLMMDSWQFIALHRFEEATKIARGKFEKFLDDLDDLEQICRASMIDSRRLAYKLWTLGSSLSKENNSTAQHDDGFRIYSFSTTSCVVFTFWAIHRRSWSWTSRERFQSAVASFFFQTKLKQVEFEQSLGLWF